MAGDGGGWKNYIDVAGYEQGHNGNSMDVEDWVRNSTVYTDHFPTYLIVVFRLE